MPGYLNVISKIFVTVKCFCLKLLAICSIKINDEIKIVAIRYKIVCVKYWLTNKVITKHDNKYFI